VTAYTLHSQGSYGLAASGDAGGFTLGTQFAVSENVTLTGIWFFVGTDVPSACAIWDIATSAEVSGTLNSSPSWSSETAGAWAKCSYSGSVTLVPGHNYVVTVFADAGASWFYDVASYWTSGAGSGGITNGPLSAPSSSAAVNGQAVYNSGSSIAFPASTVSGFDFGVDVEVTPPASSPSAGRLVVSQAVKRSAFF
jgi:hypothetical protein